MPDSNVIVAGIVRGHPRHARCKPWLERARAGTDQLVLADRTLAEAYGVMTTLPVSPRPTPQQVWGLLDRLLGVATQTVAVTAEETVETIQSLADRGIHGRIVFDALIARAAMKANVDRVVTLNTRHLLRVWPLDPARVQEP